MEKVLLAIDGADPNRKVFHYALELCSRMKAELKVLQFIRPENVGRTPKKGKTKAGCAKQVFECSMMAATFAQAGEFETADALMSEALANLEQHVSEFKKNNVPYKLAVNSDSCPKDGIVSYVRKNRNVVVAIYDATEAKKCKNGEASRRRMLRFLSKALPVPVVIAPDEA